MKALLLYLIVGLLSPLMAGSADAVIRGKTESGRTEFEIHVEDIEGLIRSVRLTIDGKTYTISEADMAHQTVIRDRKNGVYVMSVTTKGREFRLWMIPGSEKVLKDGEGVFRSRFGAVLEATDPRQDDAVWTPRITLGCTLDWEI